MRLRRTSVDSRKRLAPRFLGLGVFCLVLTLVLGARSPAQAGGRMVPVDERGQVGCVDARLNRILHVVDSLGPRGSAYLYELDDGSHALVIWSHTETRLSRHAQPMAEADVARLRSRVSELQREGDPDHHFDRSGRGELLRGMALLNAGFYGWAYPELQTRQGNETHQYAGSTFGGVATFTMAGVLLPAFATEFVPIPEGTARLGIWGGTRGILAGSLIFSGYVREQETRTYAGHWNCLPWHDENPKNERNELRTPLLTSLGGLATGLAVGYTTHLSGGDAAIIGICGDAGFIGGGLGDMARENNNRYPRHDVSFSRSALLGGATGVAVGAALSRLQSYSVGDAIIVRATSSLGALVPASVAIAADWNGRTSGPLCIGGLAAGVALGHYLTRDWDYTPTDGGMLTITALVGGGASFALASVLRPMFDHGQTIDNLALPAFTVGATTAAALAWRSLNYQQLNLDRPQAWTLELTPQIVWQEQEAIPALGVTLQR